MTADFYPMGKAVLQCRRCLADWKTNAEYLPYQIESEDRLGEVVNYESTTCPHCGEENNFWDKTP